MRVWIAGFFVAASGMAQSSLPAGPGREALTKVCSGCHSPESVVGMAKTREDWAALVGDMANQGAQGSDEEFDRIIDYLAANFPAKVNVNTAGPQLLENALGLSEKEAGALVAYREQNGKFKSMDDLAKVPGVDVKKIEARKDRIEY
ncbi:MAG TPA: helix-hairpin-helix domain-containing protein [Bryobacteraceae bacterium]|jgi:competence protein ComEA|nr:helix-hairpin-helix domain-containing protein [Bryobacteraceae bacterium]